MLAVEHKRFEVGVAESKRGSEEFHSTSSICRACMKHRCQEVTCRNKMLRKASVSYHRGARKGIAEGLVLGSLLDCIGAFTTKAWHKHVTNQWPGPTLTIAHMQA